MRYVNFHYFYSFSKAISALNDLEEGKTISESFGSLYFAKNNLVDLLNNDILPPESSEQSARALLNQIDELLKDPSRETPMSFFEVSRIQASLRTFEAVLESEYAIKPVFALSEKGVYSVKRLAENGAGMFSAEINALVPEMESDLKDAGRCIAFELSTAAAFHLFRATEAVAKAYIALVRNEPVTKKEMKFGLGGYKKILEKLGVDDRIASSIDQLVRLHRNPTVHPEMKISVEESLATLGMVQSVIRTMTIDMLRRKNEPGTPLDEFLPPTPEDQEQP